MKPADCFEILLASDFTARPDLPLDRGLRIARHTGGRPVIIHVRETKDATPADIAALLAAVLPMPRSAATRKRCWRRSMSMF